MEKIFSSLNKKFKTFTCIFFIHCVFSLIYASEIQTIKTQQELAQFLSQQVDQETLLVLDIDDTLLVAKEPILRVNFLDTLLNKLASCLNLAPEHALNLLEIYLEQTPHRLGSGNLVFPEWSDILQGYKNRSIKTIALTKAATGKKTIDIPHLKVYHTQQNTCEDRRFEDLQNVGINFQNSFFKEFGLESLVLSNYPFELSHYPPPIFKKGILFTNFHPKGEVLVAFLKQIEWKPNKVIFIDNILNNVHSVQQKMKELCIPYEGIHFTYVENNSYVEDLYFQNYLDEILNFYRGSLDPISPHR